jgi:hypothetical protein
VFQLDPWKQEAFSSSGLALSEPLSTLESTFPQTLIWSKVLVGQPAIVVSEPLVYFFVGSQGWFERCWPTIVYSFALQLALGMRENGAADEPVRHYENLLLSVRGLGELVNTPNDYAKTHFSLPWLIRNFGDRDALNRNLARTVWQSKRNAPAYLYRIAKAAVDAQQDTPRNRFARLGGSFAVVYKIGRCILTLCFRKHSR